MGECGHTASWKMLVKADAVGKAVGEQSGSYKTVAAAVGIGRIQLVHDRQVLRGR